MHYALELFSSIVEKGEIIWFSGQRKQENMQVVFEGQDTALRGAWCAALGVLEQR